MIAKDTYCRYTHNVHTKMWTVYTNVCTSYTHCPPHHRPFPSIIHVSQLSVAIIMNKTQENPREEWSSWAAVRVHGLLALVWGLGGTRWYIRVGSQGVLTLYSWEAKKCGRMESISFEGTPLVTSLPPLYLTSSRFHHLLKAPQTEDH